MTANVTIALTNEEALVLFELLARFTDDEKGLSIAHPAEEIALWNLHASLEKVLAEPFSTEYHALLERARQSLLPQS